VRVVIVTVVWAFSSMLVVSGALFLLASSLEFLVNERGWRVPEIFVDVMNYGGPAVMLIIPSVVAVLGMRGKLPGTRSRVGGRGFSVVVPEERAESDVRER
jgi:hypothetical protein